MSESSNSLFYTSLIQILIKLIANLRQLIEERDQSIGELQETIKELRGQLSLNSTNSSKPSSRDDFKKDVQKILRMPSDRTSGGQFGHKGTNLVAPADPDEIVRHAPAVCLACPNYDSCMECVCIGETRQIIDAIVSVKVTAHQSLVLECPLHGKQQKGEFPDDIKATVQYGENLQALIVSLNTIGAASVERTHTNIDKGFRGVNSYLDCNPLC
jgi:transposase